MSRISRQTNQQNTNNNKINTATGTDKDTPTQNKRQQMDLMDKPTLTNPFTVCKACLENTLTPLPQATHSFITKNDKKI